MSKKKQPSEQTYSAENIVKLDPREHIRRRPGIYIGGTDSRALFNLVDLILDFAIESVFAEKCDAIEIRLQPDNYVTISDNDQIIPELLADNDYDEKRELYILDYIFQEIIAGVKRGDKSHLLRSWGGMHGIGISAVNPLASSLTVSVNHKNTVWKRAYQIGNIYGAYQKYDVNSPQQHGVTITFQPDFTILDKNEFDYDRIAKRCQEIAYTAPDVTIALIDERDSQQRQDTYHYPDGMADLVRDFNQGKSPRHDILHTRKTVSYTNRNDKPYDIVVEIALQYTISDETIIKGFTNTIDSSDGGTHISALQHTLTAYLDGAKDRVSNWEDTAKGLSAAVHVLHHDPQFESQTKLKVLNPDIFDAVMETVYPLLTKAKLRQLL